MVLYRFKGVFELDKEATIHENRAVWKRTYVRILFMKLEIIIV